MKPARGSGWRPDPALVAEAARLGWRPWRRRLRAGHGPGHLPRSGPSGDFSEHAPYLPGDDLRRLDWRATGRQDRLLSRRNEIEAGGHLHLCVDRSGSMAGAGDSGPAKLDIARALAAALTWAAMQEGARVSASAFTGGQLSDLFRAGGRAAWPAAVRALGDLVAVGATATALALGQLHARLRVRHTLVIFGDAVDPPDEVGSSLAALTRAGHDVTWVRVAPPCERGERALPADSLVCPERAEAAPIFGGHPVHPATLRAHTEALARRFFAAGVPCVEVDTHADPAWTLPALLLRR